MSLLDSLNVLLNSSQHHDLLSIVKGCRNGAVYGAKIRFPHALVMTYLFRQGSHRDKWRFILKATLSHAKNLATFVTIYKTLMVIQRRSQGKEWQKDSFFAGLIGGWIVFGEDNPINQQIVMYLFSRIMIALAKLSLKRGIFPEPSFKVWPVFAASVWGIVMWLFRNDRDTLQSSLQASMHYLYNDSEKWNGLYTLLWHNTDGKK